MTDSRGGTAGFGGGGQQLGMASFPYWEGPGARYQRRDGSRRAVALLAAEMTGEEARLVADTLIHPLVEAAETYLATALAELAAELRRLPEGQVPGLEIVEDGGVPSRLQLPQLWKAVSQAAVAVWPDTAEEPTDEAAREAIEFLLALRAAPSVYAIDIATAVEVAAVFLEGGATGAHEKANANAEAAEYAADMREQY
jgi:hypothetical protein